MGLLKALPALVAGACYSPNADLCSHVCSTNSDCVSDQVCTNQHLCGNAAASCGDMTLDGGPPTSITDAHDVPADAPPPPPPDAGAFIDVHVHLDGRGSVSAVLVGECDADQATECVFSIRSGALVTLVATPHTENRFDRWTSPTCSGPLAICTITPMDDVQVSARFRKTH